MELGRDQVENIIKRIYAGETTSSILKEIGSTRYWLDKALQQYPDMDILLTRARASCSDSLVEEAKEIADTEPDPQKARNQIDIRKWIASKHRPDRYGDRMDIHIAQTVDIKSALDEAKKRAMLPMRFQQNVIDVQTIQNTGTKLISASDHQSPTPIKTRNAGDLSVDDIFD